MSWRHLPSEMREPILKYLTASKTGKAASYATVCKEWQIWVEQETFALVSLNPKRLDDFERIFANNLRRQVSLKRLKLFPHQAYSDLITRRHFPGFIFWQTYRSLDVRFNLGERIMHFYQLGEWGLPMVKIVTDFEIPRLGNRNLHHETLNCIFRSLPNLERIRIEPVTGYARDIYQDFPRTPRASQSYPELWPSFVKRVNFFEHRHYDDYVARPATAEFQFIGQTVARYSFDLKELVVCHLIDAVDFFRKSLALQTPRQRQWTELTLISLTSEIFGYIVIDDDLVENLLQNAGKAAALMPRLQMMELWNWKTPKSAAVFRYHVENRIATVSWVSTWRFHLSLEVRSLWARVADSRSCALIVRPERRIVHLQRYYPNAFVFADSNVMTAKLFNNPNSIERLPDEDEVEGTWDYTWDDAWGDDSDTGPFRRMSIEIESPDLIWDSL